jgi:putative ABC transport system permease protein
LNINQNSVAPEGFEPRPDGGMPSIDYTFVAPDYFRTMEIPLLEGRDFTDRDAEESAPVIIINEALAQRFWPGESAAGKSIVSRSGKRREVVGVVKTGKYLTLGEDPKPYMFYPYRQSGYLAVTAVARASGDPSSLLGRLREEAQRMDTSLPLYNVKVMEEHLNIALAPAKAGAMVLGSFGTLALLLASIGLYGMMAYAVTQRTFEIGLRRALGAQNVDVLKLAMTQGMVLVVGGLTVGIAISLAAAQIMASMLYGISATDPVVIGSAALLLILVALAACYLPARRATRVDPIIALHYE